MGSANSSRRRGMDDEDTGERTGPGQEAGQGASRRDSEGSLPENPDLASILAYLIRRLTKITCWYILPLDVLWMFVLLFFLCYSSHCNKRRV